LASSAAGSGIGNVILLISGSRRGASGFILSILMSKAMNRSFTNVLFGAFGSETTTTAAKSSAGVQVRASRVAGGEDGPLDRRRGRGDPAGVRAARDRDPGLRHGGRAGTARGARAVGAHR